MSSDKALARMIRICDRLKELPQMAQKAVDLARLSVDANIPPSWPTYQAGVKRRDTVDSYALVLSGSAIEGAVHPSILTWAQKVFPIADMAPPGSAAEYYAPDGSPYPLRIEQSGSPSYPGNRTPEAGAHVWRTAAQVARDTIRDFAKDVLR